MRLGIYVQVPFCQTKCTYCNFHTGVFARSLYAGYTAAVCQELADHDALYRGAGIGFASEEGGSIADTAYIGGGTPSLLDPVALERILEGLRASFCCQLEEVTLEADPETVSSEKGAAWRAGGIDRISLGAQSFQDVELAAAGRQHRSAEIAAAARILREAGFGNLSLDLIAGLPHQTAASWEESLDGLLRVRPEHVSIYLLEIDDASRLGREALAGGERYGAAALPDDGAMADAYERARTRLAAEGYEHYEISNWALPGFRSRHNLKYWRREPYLGFGAGAHSFNGRERWANAHEPAAYVAATQQGRLPAEQHEAVSPQAALEEELFLGLRQLEGIEFARIEQRYNVSLRDRLKALCEKGLVEFEGVRVRLNPARLTVANEAFVELLM